MAEQSEKEEDSFGVTEALKLVSSFFDQEWSNTSANEVELRKVEGGFINRLHLLKRHNKASLEPSAVLIRHFGRDGSREQQPWESKTTLSAAEQAVIYTEMSRRRWGPKIYGIFSGGRLEEWLDAHPLTAKEAASDDIRHDIARSYARLHSLQPPFRRTNFELVVAELCDRFKSKSSEVYSLLLALDCEQATRCASMFCQTEWNRELTWTASLFKRYSCKATLIHLDTNFLNVLVNDFPSDCRITLIDFETATYAYRGIDIGGHFMERMYSWSQPESKLTDFPAPEVEEQRSFCESYLRERQTLGQPMTAEDNVEHLMLEAQIGRMHQLITTILMCLVLDTIEEDPFFLDSVTHMMNSYHQLKTDFERVHGVS